jgi:hypothetical protein
MNDRAFNYPAYPFFSLCFIFMSQESPQQHSPLLPSLLPSCLQQSAPQQLPSPFCAWFLAPSFLSQEPPLQHPSFLAWSPCLWFIAQESPLQQHDAIEQQVSGDFAGSCAVALCAKDEPVIANTRPIISPRTKPLMLFIVFSYLKFCLHQKHAGAVSEQTTVSVQLQTDL